MKPSADFFGKIYPLAIFPVLITIFLVWHFSPKAESAKRTEKPSEISNYDIRADKSADARKAVEKFIADAGKTLSVISADRKEMLRAEKTWRSNGAKLKIEYNEDLRIPEVISPDFAQGGDFLTEAKSGKRADILRSFLKQNSGLIGLDDSQIDALKTSADYTNPDGNLSFAHFEQTINGIPVFRGEVKAGFTRRGEIIRIINNLAPNLDYESLSSDFGSAEQAVESAAKHIGLQANEADTKQIAAASNDLKITFERGQFDDETIAEKMYFPVDSGVARTAWRVLLWQKTGAFYVIVDASEGTLLWRKNITQDQTQTATYNVYGNTTSMMKTGDSPTPFTPGCLMPNPCPQPPIVSRQTFTLIGNEPPYSFNNTGWIPDGENRTIGNNAEAGIDRMSPNGIDDNGWAFGNPTRNFVYSYNPGPGMPPPGEEPLPQSQTYPPSPFQQGSVTNAFYAVNRWHDEMYRLGFTEPSRNFQIDNFGRGGVGNDGISVEVQDGSGTNAANFSSPADGGRPRLQLFIWTAPTPDRDGALDNQIITHEVTHGVSSRLHGNGSGLSTNMAGGMGEGWSDFYALALLSEPTDDVFGAYTIGCYVTYLVVPNFEANCFYGIRRFPTVRRSVVGPNGLPINPLTFRYVNANCNTLIGTTSTNPNSAFPRGPIGTTTCDQVHNIGEVWTQALWEVRGQLIDIHGGAEGNRRALQYITDGMKLAPLNPTMLQERDAILAAAQAINPSDVAAVWRGFAIRGMGFSASIQNTGSGNNNTVVTEAFDTPNVVITNPFTVSDSIGNNNGYPEMGEPVLITVTLTNNTGFTINNVTATIAGGKGESYGTIAHGQTVSRTIPYLIPVYSTCSNIHQITINISSDAGTRTETRGFRFGFPLPATVFSNTTPITIPNGAPTTTSGPANPYPSIINVSGLNGAASVKVELTGFTHTFPADADILLQSPGGQKFIIMSDVGGGADVSNITLNLLDAAENPMSTATLTTGDYNPANYEANDSFAAPAPASPYGNPPPVGTDTFQSAFGTSAANMNGEWKLYVVDDTGNDVGSLTGWKLIFEPTICIDVFPEHTRADFDGDGKTDVSVFRPSEGNWYLNRSRDGFAAVNWGISSDQIVPADFDGDYKTDFAVFRPNADASQPDFYVLNSSNFTYSGYSWGLPGDIPVVEDYDGDERDDIAVYRPSSRTWYVLKSGNGSVLTSSVLPNGKPVTGDFDGDSRADFCTFVGGEWWIAESSSNYELSKVIGWGLPDDKLVQADYDGDNQTDAAVYRPSNGTWYIRKSSGGYIIVPFGLANDIPVPGDYDGDRKTDIAVYRDGIWYINRTGLGIRITQFGLSGDMPIPNRYLP